MIRDETVSTQELKIEGNVKSENITINQFQIVCKDKKSHLKDLNQLMWTILELLPEPKLENLKLLAIDTVVKKFAPEKSTNRKAADYLNYASQQHISMYRTKILKAEFTKNDCKPIKDAQKKVLQE